MLELAGHSRVWIFQANRFLSDEEVGTLDAQMKPFMESWAAHGNELFGAFKVEYNLFLIVGVDEQRAPASGCSIDKLMQTVQGLNEQFGVDFLDRLTIAYEDASTEIHLANMSDFKTLLANKEVTSDTTVYNNLVENVAELESDWRTKVQDSWHKNLMQTV